jgi:hypothetical protein
MPQPADLPDELKDFAFRNAVKVDALEDFDDHVKRLIRSLDRLLQSQLSPTQHEKGTVMVPTSASSRSEPTATQRASIPDRDWGGIFVVIVVAILGAVVLLLLSLFSHH